MLDQCAVEANKNTLGFKIQGEQNGRKETSKGEKGEGEQVKLGSTEIFDGSNDIARDVTPNRASAGR